jgi:hypothetical protein
VEYILKNKDEVLELGQDYLDLVIRSLDLYFLNHTDLDIDSQDSKHLFTPTSPDFESDFDFFILEKFSERGKSYYILEFISSIG